mmetsp:Transcript_14182/g.39254  ORF Transcript_14182/g.39254 Transcript_14182/m.39254 type:complete len:123 (-) Transcript_14182:1593-1961(-)
MTPQSLLRLALRELDRVERVRDPERRSRNRPSPPSPLLSRDLERRLDEDRRLPWSSSKSRRERLERLSRYRDRRATANARKVATNKRKDKVKNAFANRRAKGDSRSLNFEPAIAEAEVAYPE